MTSWFKPLVNKVIKEGEDVTKQWATQERQIVHTTKLPDSQTDVLVTQDLNTGDVLVDIGVEKHGFASGKYGQPVRLEYKASEEIKPVINSWTGKVDTKGKKTPEEFNVEEAEFTGGHPENVKFEESTINKFGDHASDFSEVESFATGKSIKEIQKTKRFTKDVNRDVSDVDWKPTDDYASGGRVPMWLGGGLSKGKRTLSELLKYMSKGSSHGKTPSQMLYMINPKQFNQMLNNPGGIPSIAKEMIEKYTKEMKIDIADMVENLICTGKKIKKVDDDIAKYKMKIIEDIMSKGTTDRATAEQMAETILMMVKQGAKKRPTPKITDQGLLEMENIQKNLATKDRPLNAEGGRITDYSFDDYMREREMLEKMRKEDKLRREFEEDMRRKEVQEQKQWAAEGGRIGFKLGGIDKARRAFLKAMGVGAAGVGAAKSGLFGLLKAGKPTIVKDVTSVPIKNIEGMPSWFKPLVNKVIKEGTEVPSGAERVIVHKTKLPNSKTDVYVNQDLNTGDVVVDIGIDKHGFADGHLGQPVRLEYKASEVIEMRFIKDGKIVRKQ